jgi:capsular polysaccharide biosynthesis protein
MEGTVTPAQDLSRALAAVRRHWMPAVAILAITLLATAVVSRLGRPHYEATAQILIQQPDQVNAVLNPDGTTSPANAQRDVTTNAQLITSVPVADAVRRELHLTETSKQLIARLAVTGQSTSNLVEITARDARADRAARVATAVATQYQAYRRTSAQAAIQSAITAASARLDGMDAAAQASAAGRALSTRLHQLETAQAVATGGVQLVRPAAVPQAPVARLSPLTAAVALLLGLALAALAVAVLERLDPRLPDEDAIREAFELPVIGRLPGSSTARRRRRRTQAVDGLAARLRLVKPANKAQVVMVAPAAEYPGDEVAVELADALAGFEPWVMLIDANLSRWRAGGFAEPGGGLTAVLAGGGELADELIPIVPEDATDVRAPGTWQLLPAGDGATRPMTLLASAQMRQLMAAARESADVVIVAAPPMPNDGEVLALAALCDEIVVVARPRLTTRAHARAARELLGAVSARVTGVVVDGENRARLRHRSWRQRSWRRAASAAIVPPAPMEAEASTATR